jgi:hypothetical protein
MTAVIVPIAEWVGSFIASIGWSGASVEALYAVGYTATYVALEAALAYGVSEATRPDIPKPQGQELHLQIDPAYPRQMIIGERAIAGSLAAHYSSGGHNYNIHLVYPLADHPCTSLEKVYADGRLVWGTPLAHGVRTEITTYNYSGGPRVWMTWHDGRPGQAADADLITKSALDDLVVAGSKPAWTSNHKGAGVAYVHVELQWDSDILTSIPQLLFVVKGAPLYDRRKDTTAGGSGSHRLDDPSTWEYSDNVVTALDHYLLGYKVEDEAIAFGVGLRPDEVPYDLIASAADIADEDIDVGVGAAAAVIKRFRMNGIVGSEELFQSVIEQMQVQFAARVVDLGGRIGILGAEERPTVVDLTDQDQIRDEVFTFSDELAFDDLIGAVEGQFSDPAQLWEATDYERQVSDKLVLADGGEAGTRTVPLPYETDPRRAVRLASAYLQREALPVRIAGKFNQKAWKLEAGDWFTYTSPSEDIDGDVFEVIEIVKFDDFTVGLTARAVNPDFLAFDVDDDPDLGVPPDFDPVNLLLDAPSGTLANASISGGGATEPGLKFTLATIDALARELVLEVRKWDAGTSAFVGDPITITAHADQAVTLIRQGVLPNSDYKARAKCRAGHRESPWTDYSSAVTTSTTYTVPGSSLAAAIVGQGALATLNTVTASVLAAGVGKNCIIDGDFRQGTAFWYASSSAGSVVQSAAAGGGVRYLQVAGTGVTVGESIWAYALPTNALPVVPGDRIEASAYVGGANISSVVMNVQFADDAGSYISESGGFTTSSPGAGGGDLSTYTRIGGFVTAPATAKRANIVIYAVASTTSPTLKIAKPFIARATAAQTELTPWNIGFEAVPGADVTSANTAAAVTGQGSGATANDLAGLNATDAANLTNALSTAKRLIVPDFAQQGLHWFDGFGGSPESVADPTVLGYYDIANVGKVMRIAPTFYLTPKAAFKPVQGRRYLHLVRVRASTNPTSGSMTAGLYVINGLDTGYAHGNASYSTSQPVGTVNEKIGIVASDGWVTLARVYTASTPGNNDAYWRPRMDLSQTGAGGQLEVQYFDVIDVTDIPVGRVLTDLIRADGATSVTEAAVVTSSGTAAAITGQGNFATGNYYRSATDPGGAEGVLWVDTTTNTVKLYTGGAYHVISTIAGAVLTASFSPSFPQDARTGAGSRSVSCTITVSGGSGSYSYAWSILEQNSAGGTGTAVATLGATRTSATISAGCTVTLGQSCYGHLQCLVTDTSTGQTAAFALGFDMSETT